MSILKQEVKSYRNEIISLDGNKNKLQHENETLLKRIRNNDDTELKLHEIEKEYENRIITLTSHHERIMNQLENDQNEKNLIIEDLQNQLEVEINSRNTNKNQSESLIRGTEDLRNELPLEISLSNAKNRVHGDIHSSININNHNDNHDDNTRTMSLPKSKSKSKSSMKKKSTKNLLRKTTSKKLSSSSKLKSKSKISLKQKSMKK